MITCKKTVSQIQSDATVTIIGSSLEDIADKTKDASCKSEGMLKCFLFEFETILDDKSYNLLCFWFSRILEIQDTS